MWCGAGKRWERKSGLWFLRQVLEIYRLHLHQTYPLEPSSGLAITSVANSANGSGANGASVPVPFDAIRSRRTKSHNLSQSVTSGMTSQDRVDGASTARHLTPSRVHSGRSVADSELALRATCHVTPFTTGLERL